MHCSIMLLKIISHRLEVLRDLKILNMLIMFIMDDNLMIYIEICLHFSNFSTIYQGIFKPQISTLCQESIHCIIHCIIHYTAKFSHFIKKKSVDKENIENS